MVDIASYDYIIIGAGSAGSVLANRLGARPENHILVLEAGGQDHWWNWKIHMPAAFAYPLADDKVNWYYHTEPEPFMDNRRMYCPRGRVIGGSSSINGMFYIRGHARDYDRWAQAGLRGWSYAEMLPYFRRAENRELGRRRLSRRQRPAACVATAYDPQPAVRGLARGRQAGRLSADARSQRLPAGRAGADGDDDASRPALERRQGLSAAGDARAAMSRSQSRALTLAHPVRRASAPSASSMRRAASVKQARAAREVIVAGGAINSPQILMLSGIGPADHLRQHRHRRGAGSARRRAEPAGPYRDLCAASLPAADHALSRAEEPAAPASGRHRMDLLRHRPRRHQPFRGRRLHPQPCRRRASGSAISLPADRGHL